MSITDWPMSERPREKLLQQGASALSDAELLAIFLRTGVKGKSAVDLARDLLNSFGSLRALLESEQQAFCAAHGLGVAKYVQLQAVLEMSRRHLRSAMARGNAMENPQQVREYLSLKLRHQSREMFACLFLDNKHQVINFEILFLGTINAAAVYPREVVARSLANNAAAVVLAHNHPSGVAEPSTADQQITDRLVKALDMIDVRVIDHMVVGDQEVVSFAERGLL
ncbi:DNA repair protein RadC [Neptuniibacter sp. 1_MG-2023]|uniref:RadC family protein n=1 Tax=Neptuniibacter sp. 1_MG-2023 TaxID=3062662 RepID=UPI0026E35B32|nr:DNA repair protein RadC [Neptuniibacter sp. 1_MG-2023]MDO6595136.1 DNA repair protein RadC [Neptuniibacter sp. 1_MG-2023]